MHQLKPDEIDNQIGLKVSRQRCNVESSISSAAMQRQRRPSSSLTTFSFNPYRGVGTCAGRQVSSAIASGRLHKQRQAQPTDEHSICRLASSDNLAAETKQNDLNHSLDHSVSLDIEKKVEKFANSASAIHDSQLASCECQDCMQNDDNNITTDNQLINREYQAVYNNKQPQSSTLLFDQRSTCQDMQSTHSLSMQLNGQSPSPCSPSIGDCASFSAAINQQPMPSDCPPSMQLQSSGNLIGSSSKFGRIVGKKAARFKELVLQNLGRSDKTHDELFRIYEDNFYKQQAQAIKLQKEFKLYVHSLKGTQESSKSLNQCIQQATGDYQSARHDLVCENLSQLEHLSDDLMEKLREQILVSITEHLNQFAEMRDKIAKRRRKLIDYDSSRRNYEFALAAINKKRMKLQQQQQQPPEQPNSSSIRTLRSALMLSSSVGGELPSMSSTSHLVEEARLLKLREQYNYCKLMYETINGELHEELPSIYEKKMKHLLITLQNYFSLEAQFNCEAGKLFATISDVVDELPSIVGHLRHRHHQLSDSEHSRHSSRADDDDERAERGAHDLHTNGQVKEVDGQVVSGSSGMGSSRGNSSISSSSPSSSPTREAVEVHHEADEVDKPVESEVDEVVEASSEGCHSGDQQVNDAIISAKLVAEEEDVAEEMALEQVEELKSMDKVKAKEVAEEGGDGQQIAPVQLPEQSLDVSAVGVPVANNDKQEATSPKIAASLVENVENVFDKVKVEVEAKAAPPEESQEASTIVNSDKLVTIATAQVAGEEQPSNYLYKVRTNYKYLAEDIDELCFDAEEIIQVVPFEDKHEQEEGWLLGVREVNGQKGLFPANFTRPV